MENIELIKKLSNAFGPSGMEDEVLEILKEELSPKMDFEENHMRDLFFKYKNNANNKYTVLIDSHTDEVGFMIQAIRPNGMLEFLTLGGFVNNTLPSSKVLIKNDDGEFIEGMITSIPPHYLSDADKNKPLDVSQMTIDVGARSSEEVESIFHISIGNFACPSVEASFDKKRDVFFGKAFDCRIGVAAMTTLLKKIDLSKIRMNIKAAYTSQEEVGERGAISSSDFNKPDLVICFEGCPADDNFAAPYKTQTALKKGPMIRYMDRTIICNPRFMKFTIDIAKKYGIPLQTGVRAGGGNNGAYYQNFNAPTIVVGIPVRYIHTPNSVCTLFDYQAAIKLVETLLYEINNSDIEGF